jgi:hypothetical protein
MSQKYTRKDQIEEFVGRLRGALSYAQVRSNSAYPKELAEFIKPLEELVDKAADIEYKYFAKQWAQEDEEA